MAIIPMRYFAQLSFLTILSAGLSSIGSLIFTVLFSNGLHGFHIQINHTLLARPDMPDVSSYVYIFALIFIVSIVILLILDTVANTLISKNSVICRETAKSRHRHLIIRILLGVYSIGTYILLGITSIMFCLSAAISVIYAIFIAFIYSLCDLMQDRCFDMSELLPAFADRFTRSRHSSILLTSSAMFTPAIDEKICTQRRLVLCSAENNVSIVFFIGVFTCFLSLVGLFHFLMCATASSSYYSNQLRERQWAAGCRRDSSDDDDGPRIEHKHPMIIGDYRKARDDI